MKVISRQLLAFSLLLLGLFGCGSDNTPELELIEKTQQISGVAVDGYLSMAKACIDLNTNFQCDGESEYQVLTDINGRFDIVAPEDLTAKVPLLVTTSAGMTIDSDHPDQTISESYYLLSDYNNPAVVSPLTTLVYAKTLMLGDSHQAEQVLVQQLGLSDTSLLYTDFVAAKEDTQLTTEQKKEYSKIHTFSQVVTDLIAKGWAQSITNTSDDEKPKVSQLFTEKLADLPVMLISVQVDNAISTGQDIETLAALFLQTAPSLIVSKSEVDSGTIVPVIIVDPAVTPGPVSPPPIVVLPPVVLPPVVVPPKEVNPIAPTNAVIDDSGNTFGWRHVDGYNQVSDYQYSTDNGANWQEATTNPQALENRYYPVGAVQLRVKKDQQTARNVGAILANNIAYLLQPNAPRNGVMTNGGMSSSSSFSFDLETSFKQLNGYEYSSDSGSTWQAVNVKPIVLAENTYAINQVQVRVSSNPVAGNSAGMVISNQTAFTPILAPAPKAVLIKYLYKNNGVRWERLGAYPEASHYEYTNDKGITWQSAVSETQNIGHKAYDRADVGIRVKELANGQGAAASEISWVANSTDTRLFKALAYSWLNKTRTTEVLTTDGYWDKTETSCLIEHSAEKPTYWLKINNTYAKDIEEKIMTTVARQACGINDWQLLSVDNLITLAQTNLESELANFEGRYDQFFTKNDAGDIVWIKNGVLHNQYSPYSNGRVLLKWQYPGAAQAINKINALATKLQTEVASNVSEYNTARLFTDELLGSYRRATSVDDYVAVNSYFTRSQTRLREGALVVSDQLITSTNDFNSLSFLANFVSQDTLATTEQKQAAQSAITLSNIDLASQKNRDKQLTSLQQKSTELEQALVNINAVLVSNVDLKNSITSLTNAQTSYPSAINALGGAEQYNLAMQAITMWYQISDKFTQANSQLDQYQRLLDALPLAMHNDALTALTLTRTQLDTALVPFSETGFITDHQTIKQAFQVAYQSGFVTSIADAMVGTHFAKLDLAGHYMPAGATYLQGWRCVADLRHVGKNRIWALMEQGSAGSVGNVAYAGGVNNLTQVGGLLERYQSEEICGQTSWNIPSVILLESLATSNNSEGKLSIDPLVFPHHQGNTIDKYYYWSNKMRSYGNHHSALQYHSPARVSYSPSTRYIEDIGDRNYLTFARLYSQNKQTLLTSAGNEVNDITLASCAKDGTGLIWQLPKGRDVNTRYKTIGILVGVDAEGNPVADNEPNRLNSDNFCGQKNWQLPTMYQLSALYNYPLNRGYFQDWALEGNNYRDLKNYLSRDVNSSNAYYYLTTQGFDNSGYNGSRSTRRSLYMLVSEPTKIKPAAPTHGVIVDTDDVNSFAWTYVTDYEKPTDYEYSTRAGVSWSTVNGNPQSLYDSNLAIADVQIRVKAQPHDFIPTGYILSSTEAYTSSNACTGYYDNGLCYSLVTLALNHQDAIDHCLALGQTLVSKNGSVSWVDLAISLMLDTRKIYWLKDNWSNTSSYAYQVKYDGRRWKVNSGEGERGSNFPFICQMPSS
jgi:hypothetical protein